MRRAKISRQNRGAGAEAEIDRARGYRLVQLGAGAEIDLRHVDAVLLVEFLLDADGERQEIERLRRGQGRAATRLPRLWAFGVRVPKSGYS